VGLIARGPEQNVEQQGVGALLAGPPAHATGVVHHDAVDDGGGVTHHVQRFERGHLVEWSVADEPGPWALVRPGPPTARVPSGVATPEEVQAVHVRLGDEVVDLPPLDDFPCPGFEDLRVVPDATARLRFELTGTPVGRILCDIRYQDGRRPSGRVVASWPESTTPGEPAHGAPLITVAMSYRNYLKLRTGERTALEAIADGGDVGDTRWTLLLLLHGIVQSEPYLAAYRSLAVIPEALGWWGEAAPFVATDLAPA
jgi:hypothetical protein